MKQTPPSREAIGIGPAPDGERAWTLLEAVADPEMRPILEKIPVRRLAYHSAGVGPGTLFFCLTGRKVDGHNYAREAVSKGAVAVVASHPVAVDAPVVLVPDSRYALSAAAARYYRYPSAKMKVIGVTGTNGKTTTTYFLQSIYREAGYKAAILGSNGLLMGALRRSFNLTTPQSLEVQESLDFLVQQGAGVVAMEASSHALVQHRLSHCAFDCAVFTNLTREHLDYHHTMEAYLQAKARLFHLTKGKPGAGVVLNADDSYYEEMSALSGDLAMVSYGVRAGQVTVRADQVSVSADGRHSFNLWGWDEPLPVSLQLPGLFNLYNALAAAAAAWKDRLPPEAVAKGLQALAGVPGRLEEIKAATGSSVIIDYAHTPDGLEQVLKLLRSRACGRVITLFGCPGDRDRGKRPLMGRIAERYSDRVILTADNPAGEDTEAIMADILLGMHTEPELFPDRRAAVFHALSLAGPGDLVLLAGKGAEEYQLLGDKAEPYSDRQTVEEFLRGEK